jgi:hypothetical protein
LDPRQDSAVPRKVRDSNLETRTARSRLPVRHKPYFRLIEPGLHLGYRKLTSGPGTWLVRRYAGEGRYTTENLRTADGAFVLADDFETADGERILTFAQAQQAQEDRAVIGGQPVHIPLPMRRTTIYGSCKTMAVHHIRSAIAATGSKHSSFRNWAMRSLPHSQPTGFAAGGTKSQRHRPGYVPAMVTLKDTEK